MIREILLGSAVAIAVFLAILGFDITPIIFIGGMLFVLNYLLEGKMGGGLKTTSVPHTVTFDDIGGQNSAIRELKEALDFIIHDEEVKRLGIRPLKGILLWGPPGTGKTLLAKAAASYTDSAFVASSGSEFIEVYAGVGAQRVRRLFDIARDEAIKQGKKGAVVFIDEIEIVGVKRGRNEGHMEYDQTLNQLLVEMDGINPNDDIKILVIAATNRMDMLDEALLRPGRFDRQVRVDLPDKKGRLDILKIHSKGKPLASDVDLEKIAQDTFGFSGAHLEALMNEAAILAMRDKSSVITQKHLTEAVDKVIMGEKLDRRPTPEELKRVAIHETGHAVVIETLTPGSVANITIAPRGNALGFVRQTEKDDHYLYTKEELEEQIMICLGGAMAEEIILNSRSTGAANDFEQAIKYAKDIIYSGMSRLGIISKDDLPKKELSITVSEIIKELEGHVKNIIERNKDIILSLADIILREETISGELLRSSLAGVAA
ncbi:AAA family ATPase [Calorimonas adulescens]|uniref:AAA family ATPase n=1 Tax=Calorimonas adulescens TaxID=2606906 RepID=A0A5D8QE00_9THEO|nr:AAA family ATPase [Calorimonas adulescens]TZE81743.1 AAA family ATPase [Calorimonas adulescens]